MIIIAKNACKSRNGIPNGCENTVVLFNQYCEFTKKKTNRTNFQMKTCLYIPKHALDLVF